MEYAVQSGTDERRLRRRCVHICLLRGVGYLHGGHPGADGRVVGVPAHAPSSLGGVHEQVLRGAGLRLPAVQLQNHFRRRRSRRIKDFVAIIVLLVESGFTFTISSL